MATLRVCSTTLVSFAMFKINLSYFPSRARLNFRWIFKEFDFKSNMKGFFKSFLALSVKKLEKVLMILSSISGRGRVFPAESCRYMRCLSMSIKILFSCFIGKETEESVDDSSYFTIKFLVVVSCSHCR